MVTEVSKDCNALSFKARQSKKSFFFFFLQSHAGEEQDYSKTVPKCKRTNRFRKAGSYLPINKVQNPRRFQTSAPSV